MKWDLYIYSKLKTLLLFFSLIFTISITANDAVYIEPLRYCIDHSLKLIIINKDSDEINSQSTILKKAIVLDEKYEFEPHQDYLIPGQPYHVKNSKGQTYKLYFTQMPLISINTPHVIADEPRVLAKITISEPDGKITSSNIGIEYRGGWSQTYPKKSLRVEFWEDQKGEITKNVNLCGMRNDDDWNLQAMYNEPLRIRSKTSNEIWKSFHKIYYQKEEPQAVNGIEMKYVDLFINGRYQGIYALGERIDQKQLQLKNFDYDIRGELYKGVDWGHTTLRSLNEYDNNVLFWGGFEYNFPDEATDWVNLYGFLDFVINENNYNFYSNYKSVFEINNAVDYFIFLNLLRAWDNTGKNLYIARYNYSEPYYYVPWDLDGVLGTSWSGEVDNNPTGILSNGLYDRLIQDCVPDGFYNRLSTRWNKLREYELAHQTIIEMLRANHNILASNGAYNRESLVWGSYAMDATHMNYISEWLEARLNYLDIEFNKPCTPHDNDGKNETNFIIYPNPAKSELNIEINSGIIPFNLLIYNNSGQLILTRNIISKKQSLQLGSLIPGLYFIQVQNQLYTETKKFIVK